MPSTLAAGFFGAFCVVYVVACLYAAWAQRRPRAEPATRQLMLFFGTLAMASAANALSLVDPGPLGLAAYHVADSARYLAAALLFHHVAETEPHGTRAPRLVRGAYAVSIVVAALALTNVLASAGVEAPVVGLAWRGAPAPTYLGKIAGVLLAAEAFGIAYLVARAFVRRARHGGLIFVGACLLAVAVAHDAVLGAVGGASLVLTGFGFAGLTLALFAGKLAAFTERREELVTRTAELSKRSGQLGKAFRELRAAQGELVKKEQLAAIGELSAVVAHEVRNPLAIITNAVASLRREGLAPEDRTELLRILDEETSRLNQLVGDLLHYARPLAPEPREIRLRELVDKAVAPLASRANLLVEIEESEGLPRVGGDPVLLRQAIDNVVHNAVQAMPGGGTLGVALRPREDGKPGVELVVRDTGEGMDTVVRKRALDPFFTTRPAGTGLGLAIVARVVDAHGGQLTIRSELGAGTEVAIILPMHQESAPPSSMRRRVLGPGAEIPTRDSLPSDEESA